MAGIDKTQAGALIPTLWENRIQYAANKRRGLTRMINDTGSKWFGPGGTINWPLMPTWPAALSLPAIGTPLTLQDTAQAVGQTTITPTVKYTYGLINEPAALTGITDLVQAYSPMLAESIYQAIDIDIATLFQSLVNNVGGAVEWSEGDFLSAISTLLSNGGDKVELGQIFGVYHPSKWDAIMATGNIVNASIRGETNSAAKTGMVEMAYGVKLFFTANVTTSTTLRNAIFVRDCFWMARKNRPKVELERDLATGLVTKVVASHMYGTAILHKSTTPQFTTDLGVEHRTTTT